MTSLNKLLCGVLCALSPATGTVLLDAAPLPADSTVVKGVLPNGLTYYIKANSQTPGQADFYLANRAGSILEEPDQRGLAHFLEHMAFNGTRHFPEGNEGERSVRKWCERNGIKFGSDLNAYTSTDETVYNISNAPVGKAGVADTCLLILRDWASDLLLDAGEIDRERGVIREEWRARRSRFATTRLMEEAAATIYAGSRYADALPIGNMEVVDTFAPSRLRDFYEKWYRPDLQAVVVAGDVDPLAIEGKIRSLFGEIPAPENPAPRPEYGVADNDGMIVFARADAEQPTLNLSLYMKRDGDEREERDSYESFWNGYLSTLGMFILRQRLAEITREGEPRVTSASARDNGFYITPQKDAFALTLGLMPENPRGGIDAAIEVVEKLRRFGVTEEELEHAKIQNAVRTEHKRESKGKRRNAELAHPLLRNFLDNAPMPDIDFEADLQAELNETITVEDVNRALGGIIIDTNQVALLFGPTHYDGKAYDMPSESELQAWIEAAQQREYVDDTQVKTVDQIFIRELPEPGSITSRRDVGNGYVEYQLSNGINVSVRPSGLEPNRLTLYMFRPGGKSLYPDSDALNLRFLNTVVKESGAADFDFLTLEKKRRGKALRVEPFINDEEEGVKGVGAASDLKTWLEVMYLYLTEPRKDEQVFSSIINRQKSMLKNRAANPNVAYKDSLRVLLYGENERTRPLTAEQLDSVDLDRIYAIYGERFADLGGMNLVITGDVREDELEELLCRYVASLPGTPGNPVSVGEYAGELRRGRHEKSFSREMQTPSALTDLIYWTEMPYTAENDLALSVLAQLLKAQYTDSVREQMGGVYGVSVEGQFWKYPGEGCSLDISFRCAPENYERILEIVEAGLREMAQQGPVEGELMKVKDYELKTYARAVETNGWWEYVRHGELAEGIDFNRDYPGLVGRLTPEDIRALAVRLLEDSANRLLLTMDCRSFPAPSLPSCPE